MRLILPTAAPPLVQVSGSGTTVLAVAGTRASVTWGSPFSGVDNADAAFMVSGNANASLRNQGQIATGAGVKASASSSIQNVKRGTIRATIVGTSPTWTAGLSQ